MSSEPEPRAARAVAATDVKQLVLDHLFGG